MGNDSGTWYNSSPGQYGLGGDPSVIPPSPVAGPVRNLKRSLSLSQQDTWNDALPGAKRRATESIARGLESLEMSSPTTELEGNPPDHRIGNNKRVNWGQSTISPVRKRRLHSPPPPDGDPMDPPPKLARFTASPQMSMSRSGNNTDEPVVEDPDSEDERHSGSSQDDSETMAGVVEPIVVANPDSALVLYKDPNHIKAAADDWNAASNPPSFNNIYDRFGPEVFQAVRTGPGESTYSLVPYHSRNQFLRNAMKAERLAREQNGMHYEYTPSTRIEVLDSDDDVEMQD